MANHNNKIPSIERTWLKKYKNSNVQSYPEKSMYRYIYDSNEHNMDSIAMIYFDKKITYKEMFENIQKCTMSFVIQGIKQGDFVSIISLNTPETIYCIYALNRLGAVINFIQPTISDQEVLEQIDITNSKLVIILDKILDKYMKVNFSVPTIVLSVGESAGGFSGVMMRLTSRNSSYKEFVTNIETKFDEINDGNAPAIIIYTSGSTGVPKGVILSNNNVNSAAWQCSISGKNYKRGEIFLNVLPPFIAFGISMLHLCFYVGMTEVIGLVPTVKAVSKQISKYHPNRFVIGPAIIELIEQYKGNDLSFLVDLTGGGGSISLEKENSINEILAKKNSKSKYLVGYGMTELSAAVSMNFNESNKLQSIGHPLPLTNVKIVDVDNGEELTYNQIGELLISTPGLMIGYYNNDAETLKVIEEIDGVKWLHTGDLAKVDEEGFVFITGRLKRIYTAKGEDSQIYKIFPQRMEETIEEIESIDKCGVVVIKDDIQLNIPVVFVTLTSNSNKEVIKEAVLNQIREKLPLFYLPRNIIVLEQMPITSSQKIDYRKLESLL